MYGDGPCTASNEGLHAGGRHPGAVTSGALSECGSGFDDLSELGRFVVRRALQRSLHALQRRQERAGGFAPPVVREDD